VRGGVNKNLVKISFWVINIRLCYVFSIYDVTWDARTKQGTEYGGTRHIGEGGTDIARIGHIGEEFSRGS